MHILLTFILTTFLLLPTSADGATQSFEQWLFELRAEALQRGISKNIVAQALSNIEPKERIIELDRKQPEGRLTFAQYYKRVINKKRVSEGRRLFRKHKALLNKVSEQYGVQPQYLVALWGIETSYGNNTGGFGVVEALATLAYDGRRSEFFRKELFSALEILNQGHISPARMKGSWAGAMGQNQFMPSSFQNLAIDFNKDGRKDIWTSLPDVFGSSANYLSSNGWKEDERWGRRVKITQTISDNKLGLDTKKTLAQWQSIGVRLPNGASLPNIDGFMASLIQPDGAGTDAFLVYDNYRVIMRWNRSIYFATSVGLLADQIAG